MIPRAYSSIPWKSSFFFSLTKKEAYKFPCLRNFASTAKRRGRPQLRQTKKERIRLLNYKDHDTIIAMKRSAVKAAGFLEQNLTKLQDAILGFWGSAHKRPIQERTMVVMDRRWWIWHIAYALNPSICLILFMELWGKDYVKRREAEFEEYARLEQEKALASALEQDDDYDDNLVETDGPSVEVDSKSTISESDTALAELQRRIIMLETKLKQQQKKQHLAALEQQGRQNAHQLNRPLGGGATHAPSSGNYGNDHEPNKAIEELPSITEVLQIAAKDYLQSKFDHIVNYGKGIMEDLTKAVEEGKSKEMEKGPLAPQSTTMHDPSLPKDAATLTSHKMKSRTATTEYSNPIASNNKDVTSEMKEDGNKGDEKHQLPKTRNFLGWFARTKEVNENEKT